MKRVCHINDILPGRSLGFRYSPFGPDDIFLVNQGGTIYGYRNSCPHWPGSTLPLQQGQYLDGHAKYIVCRGHGALFEVETGICISGPCQGERLTALSIQVDEHGNIFVVTV